MSATVWVDPGRFVCPECKRTVARDEPAWIEDGRQLHHDPCPEDDQP